MSARENPTTGGVRETHWRCFQCDEVFVTRECAEAHFGKFEDCIPACKIGAERFRDMENQLAMWRNESDPSSKAFYELGGKHAGEVRSAEETGYARGLRDAAHEATRAEDAEATAADLLEALIARAHAERLDAEYQELVGRADAEGWDEQTGGSHLTSAWKPVADAYHRARDLERAAIAKALGPSAQDTSERSVPARDEA